MPREMSFRIRNFIPILNSLFETAGINISVVELTFFKEQVVIGFPQIESLENELIAVESFEDFELGARYIALGVLASSGRHIPIHVRFYLTSEGKLEQEYFEDNGVTLVNSKEFEKPEPWKEVIKFAVPWTPIIIRLILSHFGIISGNPK